MLDDKKMKRIYEIVDEYSFYPAMQRKSRDERIQDNIAWYQKHGYYNSCYNKYGLDIVNFRNQDDYLERWKVIKDRKKVHHKNINPLDFQMILGNKLYFYTYLEAILPNYTAKMHFAIKGNEVLYPLFKYQDTQEALNDLAEGKYVCKQLLGKSGEGFLKLEKTNNNYYINNEKKLIGEVIEILNSTRYLIQDFIVQNEEFGKISPNSINSIRIETLRYKEKTHIFYALAKFSTNDKAVLDNARSGGTFVGIDIEKGELKEYGEYLLENREGNHDTNHPVSNITYKGYPIPFWQECLDLVTSIHPIFEEFPSIGWDLAITKTGPIIIEMNSMPCLKLAQMANGGLKERYFELKKL